MSEADDFFKTLSSAVVSQTKNREKNRKRKERAEHRKTVQEPGDEPDAKKAKTKAKRATLLLLHQNKESCLNNTFIAQLVTTVPLKSTELLLHVITH